MMRAYDLESTPTGHHWSDGSVILVAASLVAGVWLGASLAILIVPLLLLVRFPLRVPMLCLVVGLLGGWLGTRAWDSAQPRQLGEYSGFVEVIGDPAVFDSALRVTVEIDGERFDCWLRGAQRRKLSDAQAGEFVWMQGQRTQLATGARRAAVRHVVGQFTPVILGDVIEGRALDRASNRVRRSLRGVAEATMDADDAALFTGLVIGDDVHQSSAMIIAFRGAGLSHLTAVSGQNVAFVLAAMMPLLRRLRPTWRWAATVGIILWFMALTRFEPSVLRAGAMAVLAATFYVLGGRSSPVRLLALAISLLVLVDPLLVWSVGFWLSVSATAGVCVVGPWLRDRLPGPQWVRLPLAITAGAQVGVALPSVLVFQRLPVVSLPANLLAVPVAGFVMLFGLPAALVAAALPRPLQHLLIAPAEWGTRWVALVARVGFALEPPPAASAACWAAILLGWAYWSRFARRHARRRRSVPM